LGLDDAQVMISQSPTKGLCLQSGLRRITADYGGSRAIVRLPKPETSSILELLKRFRQLEPNAQPNAKPDAKLNLKEPT
jgi:hypothetical protein